MKYFLTIAALFISSCLFSQAWLENNPNYRNDKSYTFPEHKAMFNSFWDSKNVENGFYKEDGIQKKAFGWKQFKRWEHFWESRVNQDGTFPDRYQLDIANDQYRSSESRSLTGDWVSLGPFSSEGGTRGVGRINQVAFHPTDPDIFWTSTPQGGLWVTEDSGQSWRTLTDHLENLTCTAIGIPSDYESSRTIYLGTGDMHHFFFDNGIGILKSTDEGESWNKTGLNFHVSQGVTVGRILIHPNDPDFLYAGTSNGIYMSDNAGDDWVKISEVNVSDLEFDPNNPSIVYAAHKESGRIYKLTDDGQAISTLVSLNAEGGRRIELAVAPSIPTTIYAVVSNENSGLKSILKSTDEGETFNAVFISEASVAKPNILGRSFTGNEEGGQAWYDLAFAVDPENPNTLYCGGIYTWKSTDGGQNWELTNYGNTGIGVQPVHVDKHYMAFNQGMLYECNDGTLYRTADGVNWELLSNGIVNSEIYKLGVSQTVQNDIVIGLQDNNTKSYVDGIWTTLFRGDGMDCMIDHQNENIQYGESQYGNMRRTLDHWENWENITPEGAIGDWVTPMTMDPADPSTIYAGFQHLYKSNDRGDNWEIVFDLNTAAKFRTLAIAPSAPELIYAGEPYRLWKTTDGGIEWENITEGLPYEFITGIAVKRDDPSTLWVTLGGYNALSVYESTDGGSSWMNMSNGIPEIPVNCIVQNVQNEELLELYVGTDFGVYFKLGDDDWLFFNDNMPKVPITDLEFYYDELEPANTRLRAATYGRGLWESDPYYIGVDPVAEFEADKVQITEGVTVNFNDLSSQSPFAWYWEFEGGIPATSNEADPSISYNESGTFDVQLVVSNGTAKDTLIKEDFIVVNCDEKLNYLADRVQNIEVLYEDLGDLGTEILVDNYDDANSQPIDIGFEFEYNCENFSQFILNTNGLLKFGNTPPSSASLYFDDISGNKNGPFASPDPADQYLMAPFNHDLQGDENTEYRVAVSGNEPQRVCTIQFKNLKDKQVDDNSVFESIEFQVKLYESSHIIEFVYGDWISSEAATTYRTATCGLKGSGNKDEDVLLASKLPGEPWTDILFENGQYEPDEHSLNFNNYANTLPGSGRLFRFIPHYFRDLSIDDIYFHTKSPAEFGNPDNIQAVVHNKGLNDLQNVPVTLSIDGSNQYQYTAIADRIEAGSYNLLSFTEFQPATLGINQLKVQLPADDMNENNVRIEEQEITLYDFSYSNEKDADIGLGFPANESGIFSNRFEMKGNASVEAISAFIFDDPSNIGQEVFGAVLNENGSILSRSDTLTLQEEHLGTWQSFILNEQTIIVNEVFHAGLGILESKNEFDFRVLGAQREIPSRPGSYFVSDIDGGNLTARDENFNYKYMINAHLQALIWTDGVASAKDSIVCFGAKGRVSVPVKISGMHWEVSPNGLGGWAEPIGGFGATGKTYLTDELYEDQYYRVRVPHDEGYFSYSNVVHIGIAPVYSEIARDTICQGDEYFFPDGSAESDIQESFDYNINHSSIYDCDSIINVKVEVLPDFYIWDTISICKGEEYTFMDGNVISDINQDTIYEIVFPWENGCDSILATSLIIHRVETGIMESDTSLFAILDGANYQWIDCENGNSAIAGAADWEFIPERSGFFALIVDDGSCIDTSECVLFIHSSSNQLADDSVLVYPNPSKGKVNIYSQPDPIKRIRVLDAYGREVMASLNPETNNSVLYIDFLDKGIYYLEIISSEGSFLKKLILE